MSPTQAIERLKKYDLIGEWSAIRSGTCGTWAVFKITPQCTDKGGMDEASARLAVVARNAFPLLLAVAEACNERSNATDHLLSCYRLQRRPSDIALDRHIEAVRAEGAALAALAAMVEEMDKP